MEDKSGEVAASEKMGELWARLYIRRFQVRVQDEAWREESLTA